VFNVVTLVIETKVSPQDVKQVPKPTN